MKNTITETIKEMIEINAAEMETKLIGCGGTLLDKHGDTTSWKVIIKRIDHTDEENN